MCFPLTMLSAYPSATSMTARLRLSSSWPHSRRQQAQMNSRNLRALTFPMRDLNIGSGSSHSSHSASVTASFLPQDEIHRPAAARVESGTAAVGEDVGVGAA